MKYKFKNWQKHFWITIYIFAKNYPNSANQIIKRKYYFFFSNISEFIPDENIKKQFIHFIKKYSIVPYLDTKLNLLRWINFIHNKINKINGLKPMSLRQREKHINNLLNPPIKEEIKDKIPINKRNICNVIIVLLIIYIFLTFI